MIKAFSSNAADHSFHIWILERRSRRGDHFFDPHPLNSISEILPVNAVAIAQQIPGGLMVWECFDDLSRRPFGGRMLGDIEMNNSTPSMRKDDETIVIARGFEVFP